MTGSPGNASSAPMSRRTRLFLLPPALALFGWFFVVYVPFVRPFLIILVPLLALTAAAAATSRERGLLVFVLLFPLVNGLPYFFGIHDQVPHAPVALVLFLAFLLGSLANGVLIGPGPERDPPLGFIFRVISLVVLVSAAVTLLRYMDFFPFVADARRELVVNAGGVRSGGAVMSGVFNALSYLTGFLFFVILSRTLDTWKGVRRVVSLLALSMGGALAFALVQSRGALALGNTPFWVELRQINGTFRDPNAFAAFLSCVLPLFLGAALSSRRRPPVAWLAPAALGLIVFPSTGSRSGLAALVLSLAVLAFFEFLREGSDRRRRRATAGLAVLGIVLVLASTLAAGKGSILGQRLRQSSGVLSRGATDDEFFNMRLKLWRGALLMMREYPVSGVGVGAYIVEYPNVVGGPGAVRRRATDSALNYFLQAGAEMGVVGLLLFLGLFLALLGRVRRAIRLPAGGADGNGPLISGAAAGLVGLFLNLQLHTYIGSFEVIYLMWLLVAIVSFRTGREGLPERGRRASPALRAGAAALILLYGGVHLRNSLRSLSIPSETERYGWVQDFGFYPGERDESGRGFRWMAKSAGLSLPVEGSVLSLHLLASHPDLAERPVLTRIFLADRHFRKKGLLKEVRFERNEWLAVRLGVPPGTSSRFHIVFETDRDWRPRSASGSSDPRSLALAMRSPYWRRADGTASSESGGDE